MHTRNLPEHSTMSETAAPAAAATAATTAAAAAPKTASKPPKKQIDLEVIRDMCGTLLGLHQDIMLRSAPEIRGERVLELYGNEYGQAHNVKNFLAVHAKTYPLQDFTEIIPEKDYGAFAIFLAEQLESYTLRELHSRLK